MVVVVIMMTVLHIGSLVEAAVHAAAPARGQAGGVLGILAKAHHLAVPVGAGLVLLVHQVEQRRGRRHGGDGLQRRQRRRVCFHEPVVLPNELTVDLAAAHDEGVVAPNVARRQEPGFDLLVRLDSKVVLLPVQEPLKRVEEGFVHLALLGGVEHELLAHGTGLHLRGLATPVAKLSLGRLRLAHAVLRNNAGNVERGLSRSPPYATFI
mmetsp:Transcript_4583/g.8634  ORF Transcript_4583/g.8634 Transcript_4583/m.8634 type:complete len:209 (-) Transcript_4583:199-825(-)